MPVEAPSIYQLATVVVLFQLPLSLNLSAPSEAPVILPSTLITMSSLISPESHEMVPLRNETPKASVL